VPLAIMCRPGSPRWLDRHPQYHQYRQHQQRQCPGLFALPPTTAAQVTGDDGMVLAAAMAAALGAGSALMVMARSIWAQMEPSIIEEADRPTGPDSVSSRSVSQSASQSSNVSTFFGDNKPVTSGLLHGIDVGGSKYFGRRRVLRAVDLAAQAHEGQVRKTRQPYVTHCIETALIVEALLSPNEEDERAEDAVISALLHDAIDDGGLKPDVIGVAFGENVMSMVTKVSQLSTTNQLVRRKLRLEGGVHAKRDSGGGDGEMEEQKREMEKRETEKLRTMIVTMVSEPLVIVIKLADRLHNMRTVRIKAQTHLLAHSLAHSLV
jgi:hypothetical protein